MAIPAANDLREFLRTRRARVSPRDAGLPPQLGVRRVPGLRREEVALLAGVSAEYYERIERGRIRSVSSSVLDAIARVLQMDATERDHLYTLVTPTRGGRVTVPTPGVRASLRRALDLVSDVPALILGPRSHILAINALGEAFYTGLDLLPKGERNMVRYLFTVDAARELYDDWTETARKVVAGLRVYAGSHPHDPKLTDLVGDLVVRDPDFRQWWADHDVDLRDHGAKLYHHPVVGKLELGYESFTPVGEVDIVFGMHTVEPNSESAGALGLLASWSAKSSHQRLATERARQNDPTTAD